MARVQINLEKVGTVWEAEVVGQRGGRRLWGASRPANLDDLFAWVRGAVAEVDPDEAERQAASGKRKSPRDVAQPAVALGV